MAYAETAELFRLLNIRESVATDEQTAAAERCLDAAAAEIDAELDLAADAVLDPAHGPLLEQVNLNRAMELWQTMPHGVTGLGSEFGPVHLARNSWDKHAYDLAPAKGQWGLA